jgi:hypothetical protein
MAFSSLPAKTTSSTLTLSDYNKIKNNWSASAVGIVTTAGDTVYATGANALARLAIGADDSILVVTSGVPAWQIVPACHLIRTADQDPATSTWVSLDFPTGSVTENSDTNSMHNPASNSTRITIPANGGGHYIIGMCAIFDTSGYASGGNNYGVRFLLNGATVIGQRFGYFGHNSIDTTIPLTTMYPLSATDYIEAQIYTVNDINVIYTAGYSPVFWAIWDRKL